MKKLRFLWGVFVGALFQYLYDPQGGESRRARLTGKVAEGIKTMRRPDIAVDLADDVLPNRFAK